MDAFEKLTLLQKAVGYKPGDINVIALLGLFGEAGEVLDETILMSDDPWPERKKQLAMQCAQLIDGLKKKIRDSKEEQEKISVYLDVDSEQKFDFEIADCLYYLNALAINRGKTLADYAEMSYQKVSAKTQINIEGK